MKTMAGNDTPSTDAPPKGQSPRLGWKNWVALGSLLAGMYAWQTYASNREAHPLDQLTAFYGARHRRQDRDAHDSRPERNGPTESARNGGGSGGHELSHHDSHGAEPELFSSLRKQGVKIVVESEEQPVIASGPLGGLALGRHHRRVVRSLPQCQKMLSRGGPFGGLIKQRSHRFERRARSR